MYIQNSIFWTCLNLCFTYLY